MECINGALYWGGHGTTIITPQIEDECEPPPSISGDSFTTSVAPSIALSLDETEWLTRIILLCPIRRAVEYVRGISYHEVAVRACSFISLFSRVHSDATRVDTLIAWAIAAAGPRNTHSIPKHFY